MDVPELLSRSRVYLTRFDYEHYPADFDAFCRDAEPLLKELSEEEPAAAAAAVIGQLEIVWEALPRRQRKDLAFQDKQVLALFLAPAAKRLGGAAPIFLEELNRQWNVRFPGNRFFSADYETILRGFDDNLFGLLPRRQRR